MSEVFINLESFEIFRKDSLKFACLENRYLVARLKSSLDETLESQKTLRMDGIMILRLRTGHIELEINFERYKLTPGNVLILNPGAVISNVKVFGKTPEWDILFVATDFMKDLNIDLRSVNTRSLTEESSPVMLLTRNEIDRFSLYLKLLAMNAESESSLFSVKIARSLLSATFFLLLDFFFTRVVVSDEERNVAEPHGRYRRPTNYVRDFMRLLHQNYMRERSSEFYASKLCISSKYLSIVVKEATGRTVSDWISEFVIMEAKNLLRFSGKSVQQVAYSLNFPSQSSFGKYFKRLTGISPTEYQRT